MAGKNITIAGATFNGVPSIDVPVSGGGTASYVEVSDTTAAAADVASGKYFYTAAGVKTEGTASGGGATLITKTIDTNGTYNASSDNADGYSQVTVNVSGGGGSVEPKDVNFIDYDGTVLYSYTAQEAAALDALPANPSHTGLTAQGWNYTLAQMKTEVTAQGKCTVGQMYTTADGKTRLYCHFEQGRLAPYLGICPNGTVIVDWGDNTATDTLTGTSLTAAKTVQHSYAAPGDYVITLTVTTSIGKFAFYGGSNTSYILRKDTNTSAHVNKAYTNALKRVELGSGATIGTYAFRYCTALESITIPTSVDSLGTYAFSYCTSLKCVVLPNSVARLSANMFYYNYGFARCSIPSTVTRIDGDSFHYCYPLVNIVIPSSVTLIGSSAFSICYALASITIPESVTSIGNGAFDSNYGLAEIHFKRSTPPTVSGSNAWANIPTDCVIYVPYSADHSVLEAYKAASNYPSPSSYTYVEE